NGRGSWRAPSGASPGCLSRAPLRSDVPERSQLAPLCDRSGTSLQIQLPSRRPWTADLYVCMMSIMTDTVQAVPATGARDGLPAGPPLPQWVQTVLMLYRWPRFVAACRHRYGSVFTVDIASMGRIVYL